MTPTVNTRKPRAESNPAVTEDHYEARVERVGRREWVRLGDVKVNPAVQREFVPSKANEIAANFNLEHLGLPVVNLRGGHAYAIDGQHRIAALRIWLGDGAEDQYFEAEVYTDMTEQEEAEAFLVRNNTMSVTAYNKFRVAVISGREDESAVAGIVRREGLSITKDKYADGRILAVGTLLRIYRRAGADVLQRTLRILRDSYGSAGLEAATLQGMSMVVHRYDDLDDRELVTRLSAASGGVTAVLDKAERAKRELGDPKTSCVAAAIVETFNSMSAPKKGGNGTRLMTWWRAVAND